MKKSELLLKLLTEVVDPAFMGGAVDPLKKQLQRDGIRVQKSGNTVTLASTKTGKKVVLKDNGRQVSAKKIQNNRQNGPEEKTRGSAGDIQREIDWMKTK